MQNSTVLDVIGSLRRIDDWVVSSLLSGEDCHDERWTRRRTRETLGHTPLDGLRTYRLSHVDTVIIVIVIVIASRDLITMQRSRRSLSRWRLTSMGHGLGTPLFIYMQLPANRHAESANRVEITTDNNITIICIARNNKHFIDISLP